MEEDNADLELLASLLEENEAAESSSSHLSDASNTPDAYDQLFDGDEEGSYHESESAGEERESEIKEEFDTLFGDTDDLEDDKPALPNNTQSPSPTQEKSKKELEEELRKMQEQMKRLQEQLQHTGIAQSPSTALPRKSPANKSKPAPKSQCSPLKERNLKSMQESSAFADQLASPSTSKRKNQETVKRKLPISAENSSPPQKKISNMLPQTGKSVGKPSPAAASTQPAPRKSTSSQQVSFEKFSGLRLRNPRVSSLEMDRKMNGRKMVKLCQLQSKIATEKLEDQDWVTFGAIIKKVTPQSSNNGKTFSIWRLNDLKNFDTCVSLFLFGDVHKDHWKTDHGTVIGILNANPMKPKEGSDEVCLSVDNPQKILLLGEAMDLGTCKARKKNGDPCTQMVNLNDCEFCQYHVQAQYKKVSAKRADLQSSYSGHVPKKTARGGNSLKEKLCQGGFHYGGMSSMAYAASIAAAAAPKKSIQTTLSAMVVRGADAIALEARQNMAAASKKTAQCSDEFKELLTVPTPGALNLKKHLSGQSKQAPNALPGSNIQSLSASELLKQQKKQLLDARRKRSDDIQQRFLESTSKTEQSDSAASASQVLFQSPKQAAEFPKAQKMSTPKLGRGFTDGEDILFFDGSPPSNGKLKASAEAKKLAAIRKLQTKGQMLKKQDPNSIKRKRSSSLDIDQVAERANSSSTSLEADDEEPAMKRHKEQIAYLQSEEFQKILKAKSKHTGVLKEAEAEIQEQYFDPLVKKEQLEDKMKSIREQKCRVVTCKTCKYTHYKPLDTCVSENHVFHWHDAVKRFFKCPCGNRTIAIDRLPKKTCSTCGLFKWERDGMLKEKKGPKIAGETLLPRGEEHGKFLNSS